MIKLISLSAILLLTLPQLNAATTAKRTTREEYVELYRHIAVNHQRRYGIPASITMAQGILESDCGNSRLSKSSNNHFGIKCKSDWKGRSVTYTDDAPDECFRAYPSVESSYEDHANFLDESPRYNSLFELSPTDYKSWAKGLKSAGYATAPDYAQRLVKIIEDSKLYLLDIEAAEGTKAYDKMMAANGRSVKLAEKRVDPKSYQVAIGSYKGYSIYKNNRTKYVIAKPSDTYRSIGQLFKQSRRSLAKHNDSKSVKRTLTPGEVVYIEQKQRRWRGNVREHRVQSGETVQSISQSYGIRLRALRKRNELKRKETLKVGTTIRIK